MAHQKLSINVDGTDYQLDGVSGTEAIGAHFRLSARLAWQEGFDPKSLIGKDFALTVYPDDADLKLHVTGVVVAARVAWHPTASNVVLDLGPAHEVLTLGQSSMVYLAKTSADIVKDVISRAGLDAAKWTAATPPTRDHCAQYRESDSAFIDRIVREDGVYWFYDHADTTSLVFADDASNAESVSGSFMHRMARAPRSEVAWVSELHTRSTAQTTKVTTRDYDPKKPTLAIEGNATTPKVTAREVYEWPAVVASSGDATTRAKTALEGLRARAVVVSGRSNRLSIRCGKVIDIDSTSLGALQKLFVIGVEWSVDEVGTQLQFTAVPSTTPFRLPLQPRVHASLGVETSWVRGASGQEIDVDASGDAFVQPIWDRSSKQDDTVTIRSRSGQMQLGRSMTLPRIGWSMLVGHREGDIDRPWIVARLVDGKHPLPYKLPDNMTQTAWQTLTSKSDGTLSEIVYEDKKDNEKVSFHAAKDMKVEIGNDEARTVGNNHTLEVDQDRSETIDADDKLTVNVDQTTTVKQDESTTIEGSRSITVKGKEDNTVTGKRAEAVTGDRTVDVGKNRTLTVTGMMSASSKKGFTREVLKKASMTAGAGWTTQADGGLTTTTKGDESETVGAARMALGKNGVQTKVKGDYKDTVAAAHAVVAAGGASESAKDKSTLTVGAALTGVAPDIEIVAESELTITCGGSSISMKPSEVQISGPVMALAGPLVVISGAQVKHNP